MNRAALANQDSACKSRDSLGHFTTVVGFCRHPSAVSRCLWGARFFLLHFTNSESRYPNKDRAALQGLGRVTISRRKKLQWWRHLGL